MRTTVEIDADLVRELKNRAHRENGSMRQELNLALRRGLQSSTHTRASPKYRCPAMHMGVPMSPSIDLDKALALAGALEDAETTRELELRK